MKEGEEQRLRSKNLGVKSILQNGNDDDIFDQKKKIKVDMKIKSDTPSHVTSKTCLVM